MLVILTLGLNFINVLCTAFTRTYPKSVKDTDDLTVLFYAAHKTLVKLTPDVQTMIAAQSFTILP